MKRYVIISIGALWIVLAAAWALAYFVAWQWGMGLLSILVIAAWNAAMRDVIERKYKR